MFGIPLFESVENLESLRFDYEIRALDSLRFEDYSYIACGDKSGHLRVLRLEHGRCVSCLNERLERKVIGLRLLRAWPATGQPALLVALETHDSHNLLVFPQFDDSSERIVVSHELGLPQFIGPSTSDLDGDTLIFGFQSGMLLAGSIDSSSGGRAATLVHKWSIWLNSKPVAACGATGSSLDTESSRTLFVASFAGTISRFSFVVNSSGVLYSRVQATEVATLQSPVKSILPLQNLARVSEDLEGIIGIAGSTFFCAFRSKREVNHAIDDGQFTLLTEAFGSLLQSIAFGCYSLPGKRAQTRNAILLGDSDGVLRSRMFSEPIGPKNLYEVMFRQRDMHRQKCDDRVLTMLAIGPEYGADGLLVLALGMGNHQLKFVELRDKSPLMKELLDHFPSLKQLCSEQFSSDLFLKEITNLAIVNETKGNATRMLLAILSRQRIGEDTVAQRILSDSSVDPRLIDQFVVLIYWLLSSSTRSFQIHVQRFLCQLITEHGQQQAGVAAPGLDPVSSAINTLVGDIEKFWVGGKSYSHKIGNLIDLVRMNRPEKKLDSVVYQACLNDRGYSIEAQARVSDYEIWALRPIGAYLLVSDNGGYLHCLKPDFSRDKQPIDVKKYDTRLCSGRRPSELHHNFVRDILLLPGNKYGVLVLWTGGLWRFPLDEFICASDSDDTSMRIESVLFENRDCKLLHPEIFVYSIRIDPSTNRVFAGDRVGMIYELRDFNQEKPKMVQMHEQSRKLEYNPVWDFDLLESGVLVFGTRSGAISRVNVDDHHETINHFNSLPYFNICKALGENRAVFGTEQGNVVALDFSGSDPHCIWTYSLPGPIRFIENCRENNLLIGGMCSKAVVISDSGAIRDDFYMYDPINARRGEDVMTNRVFRVSTQQEYADSSHLALYAGDHEGIVRKVTFYQKRLFEDDIVAFLKERKGGTHDRTRSDILLRCIDVEVSALKRLFTVEQAQNTSIEEMFLSIKRMARTRRYGHFAGVLLALLPNCIRQFQSDFHRDHTIVKKHYYELQDSLSLVTNAWGLENESHCQDILKTLGVELLMIMTDDSLSAAIEQAVVNSTPNTMKSLVELVEDVHVHCIPSSLIDIYDRFMTALLQVKEASAPSLDGIISLICTQLSGGSFDKHMPDPLLQKATDILACAINAYNFCSVKLCHILAMKRVDINVFHHLIHKTDEDRKKDIMRSFYFLCRSLLSGKELAFELDNLVDSVKRLTPERSSDSGFRREFAGYFDAMREVLDCGNWLDFAAISHLKLTAANLEDLPMLEQLTMPIARDHATPTSREVTQEWLSELSQCAARLVEVTRACDTDKSPEQYPFMELLSLRRAIRNLKTVNVAVPTNNQIYGLLLFRLVRRLDDLLTGLCEHSLPISVVSHVATKLDRLLSAAKNQHDPIPTILHPKARSTYVDSCRLLWLATCVSLDAQIAVFRYWEEQRGVQLNVHQTIFEGALSKPQMATKEMEQQLHARQKHPQSFTFSIFLPTENDVFAEFNFIECTFPPNQRTAYYLRHYTLFSVLNLFLQAFNTASETEFRIRLSQKLFAHQSGEPITSILKLLEPLTDEEEPFYDPDGSQLLDYLRRIERLAKQVLRRAEYILNVAKEFSDVAVIPEEFDLATMVNEVTRDMRGVMRSLSIQGDIYVERTVKQGTIVHSDEDKIRQILEQLLRNSMKYCEQRRRIELEVWTVNERVFFTVSDNGVGIPEAELPYVFTLYYRGQYSEEHKIDGTGLGLWASWHLTRLLGGRISVADRQPASSGTVITLELPRHYAIKGDAHA